MGWPGGSQDPLGPAIIGIAEGTDFARGSGQAGSPFNGVVAVLGIAVVGAVKSGSELSVRGVAAAHVLDRDQVAAFGHFVTSFAVGVFIVRGAAHQGGKKTVDVGAIEVRAQDGAVPHRSLEILF